MNRKIILFGAFLSAFILILVPNISCVNANIQNEKILNQKFDFRKSICNLLMGSLLFISIPKKLPIIYLFTIIFLLGLFGCDEYLDFDW